MIPHLKFPLVAVALCALSACSTVTDMVVTNLPNDHHGRAKIVVKLHEQQATLYKGGAVVAESRVSTGREGTRTPIGVFHVSRKDVDHRSSVYGNFVDKSGRVVVANVDARKRSAPPRSHFVGASMPFFLEFRPGYGLHAGYLPGYPASHGCVRMPWWKARQFFKAARLGTTVVVER